MDQLISIVLYLFGAYFLGAITWIGGIAVVDWLQPSDPDENEYAKPIDR